MTELITKRIDAVTHIPPERLKDLPPAPKSVKIELSGRCNYRCGFCALGQREQQPKEDMDFELFKRITVEMADAGVEEIGLFYIGESFMNPELLINAIRYLKRDLKMPYVFLTSNASLATPVSVVACMEAGLDSLKWSINASDENQFAEVMKVSPKMFQRALDNIKQAYALRSLRGFKTKLYASSIRYDGEQGDRMRIMLEEHVIPYVDQHYWLPLYSMGGQTDIGRKPTPGNTGRADAPVAPLPCWAAFTEGHVLVDGRLSACCFDASGRWIMGDLKTQSFIEAWHATEFAALRAAHIRKDVTGTECERCVLVGG